MNGLDVFLTIISIIFILVIVDNCCYFCEETNLDNYEPNEIDRKCWNRLNEHQDKINEIIDEVNKLKKESDK